MSEKELKKISEQLESIKILLVLLLQKNDVKGASIAKALGISPGRLSQLLSQTKYKNKE